MDCLEQKEFLQWNTRTKDHLCANFQDIWLSSKSWILDIKYAISTIKMQILNQFFRKKIHYIVVISVPSFHQPARSSSFFLAFCLQFYGTTFYGWPYISEYSTLLSYDFFYLSNIATYDDWKQLRNAINVLTDGFPHVWISRRNLLFFIVFDFYWIHLQLKAKWWQAWTKEVKVFE